MLADAEDINPSGDVQMEWDMVEAFLDWLDLGQDSSAHEVGHDGSFLSGMRGKVLDDKV